MDIGFRALVAHSVHLPALDSELALERGEQLRFEISAKFTRMRVADELGAAGLRIDGWWTDAAGDFALLLACRSVDAR